MHVRVFRNLTRRCLSIMAKTPTGWRTVAHASRVSLDSPTFHVSEAGRQRVLRTGRKVVHAWVQGDLRKWDGEIRPEYLAALHSDPGGYLDAMGWCPSAAGCPTLPDCVTYNPRKYSTFVVTIGSIVKETRPVASADRALLTLDSVTVSEPRPC